MLFSNTIRIASPFLTATILCATTMSYAQQREDLKEPVYRVVNTNSTAADRPLTAIRPQIDRDLPGQVQPVAVHDHLNKHPAMLAALEDANACLANIQTNVKDYSCVLVRRENVNGKLLPPEWIQAKIRQRQVQDGKTVVPFSVYLKFLKPAGVKGREILYIEGQNNNKLLVKEGGGGIKSRLPSMNLATTSSLVMKSCRYPVTDVGVENLTLKLIERGMADDGNVANIDYTAEYRPGAKLNGRSCNYLKVDFLTRKPVNEANRLEIFIDSALMVPIRYVAYAWPAADGQKPPVMEEYTYLNLKPNNGFTDKDFDKDNPNYNF